MSYSDSELDGPAPGPFAGEEEASIPLTFFSTTSQPPADLLLYYQCALSEALSRLRRSGGRGPAENRALSVHIRGLRIGLQMVWSVSMHGVCSPGPQL